MKDYGKLVRRVHDSYNIKTGVLFFPASAAVPLHTIPTCCRYCPPRKVRG